MKCRLRGEGFPPSTFSQVAMHCSIARSLELVGERWTILVLRDVFLGRRRFDQMQRSLGVARNVLAARLDRLVRDLLLLADRKPATRALASSRSWESRVSS